MDEEVKLEKRKQHAIYHQFLVMMCVVIVSIGVVGIIGYIGTGLVIYTIGASIGIVLAILLMTNTHIKSRIIYKIRGE
jgi:nitrate reductase NapE component